MRIKYFTVQFIVLALILVPLTASAQDVEITMASTATEGHSYYKAAAELRDEVEKRTDGRIQLNLDCFSGVLGGEREMTEMVQRGNLKMAWISDVGLGALIPEMGFISLPYLFSSYDEVDEYYFNGWVGEEVKRIVEENGIKPLGFIENDFRGLTSSEKPIKKIEDFDGMKIRVPEIRELNRFFNLAGANTTSMPITDVLSALETGTIDGQDNGVILTWEFRFHEAQDYLVRTNHVYSGGLVIADPDFWESLSPDDRELLEELTEKYARKAVEYNRSDVEKFIERIEKEGVEVMDSTDELDREFQKIAKKVWEDFYDDYDPEIMDRLIEDFGG